MQESIPKESPFTPGRPVPIEYFVARNKEIQRLERAIQQTASGRNENIFIEGERGIGNPKTMSAMVDFSGGFPMLMHEIGDAVFWQDTDCLVDYADAMGGILFAAENVGKKYLDPQVYRTIGSETYRSILRKMGQFPFGKLQRKLILEKMTETEQKTFDNFLKKMKHLGMICDTEVRGEYAFTNLLYQLYVRLEALTSDKEISGK